MPELRKDYILDRWVIIAPKRSKRPHEFKTGVKKDTGKCDFCPGNEDKTPKEILKMEKNGKWFIRVFPNKFPAVEKGKEKHVKKGFFESMNAVGQHEILVETNDHNKQLWDLSEKELELILQTYVQRITSIKTKYVLIFKNHGQKGGTSLVHSHTQIIGYNKVPSLVEEKVKAVKKFRKCPYCEILKKESKSERRCFGNKSFVAFTPFASRFPYEVWIMPKKHLKSLIEVDDMNSLAEILKKILIKLKKMNAPYNFFIHNAPKGKDLHFHIVVLPRFETWAGFELGSEDIINVVSPEDAARYYRK